MSNKVETIFKSPISKLITKILEQKKTNTEVSFEKGRIYLTHKTATKDEFFAFSLTQYDFSFGLDSGESMKKRVELINRIIKEIE
jgi:hypothetical protein